MRCVESHLFIETPYRNQRVLSALFKVLPPTWWLSACCDLTLPNEMVLTKSLKQWSSISSAHFAIKRPVTFVLSGPPAWIGREICRKGEGRRNGLGSEGNSIFRSPRGWQDRPF